MTTKMIGGLVFPAEEQHFLRFGSAVHRDQEPQRVAALSFVTCFDLCLDVGAHVGIFSRHFSTHFDRVMAFEPIANLRGCLRMNVPANVEIVPKAVGDRVGTEKLLKLSTTNSGCSFIVSDERVFQACPVKPDDTVVEVEMVTIDSLNLEGVGLIKIDVQGADHLVLQGAMETLRRCKPVVLVEEKPVGGPTGPVEHIAVIEKLMTSVGATKMAKVGADRIWVFGP
jgi:FkbM family methyltransferase